MKVRGVFLQFDQRISLGFPFQRVNTTLTHSFSSNPPVLQTISWILSKQKLFLDTGEWSSWEQFTFDTCKTEEFEAKGKQKEFIPSAAIPSPGNSLPPGQSLTDLRGFCYQQVQMCQGEWRCHCPLPRDNSLLKTFPGHFRLACARGGLGLGQSQHSRHLFDEHHLLHYRVIDFRLMSLKQSCERARKAAKYILLWTSPTGLWLLLSPANWQREKRALQEWGAQQIHNQTLQSAATTGNTGKTAKAENPPSLPRNFMESIFHSQQFSQGDFI